MGTNCEEPVKEVFEALSHKTAAVAMVLSKYWTKARRDHTSSCTTKDMVVVNQACIARALSTIVQLEGLVKDLWAKNVDLAQKLEKAVLYGYEVRITRAKSEEAESRERRGRALALEG